MQRKLTCGNCGKENVFDAKRVRKRCMLMQRRLLIRTGRYVPRCR